MNSLLLVMIAFAVQSASLLQGQTNSPASPPVTAAGAGAKLVDLHLQSKDRMFRGVIKVEPSWEHTALRFVNLTSKQDLGTYPDILENMNGAKATVKIYTHQKDMFSDEDMKEAKTNPLITQLKLIFFKDDTDPTLLNFSSIFDDVGTIQVQVIQKGKVVDYGETKLTRDVNFSALIQATDNAISGPQPALTNQAPPSAPPAGK